MKFVTTFIEEWSVSPDTGICCWLGIRHLDSPYAKRIKIELLTKAEVEKLGISFIDTTDGKGRIGALEVILWANGGVEIAGLYGKSA